jgi:hypothetical protein
VVNVIGDFMFAVDIEYWYWLYVVSFLAAELEIGVNLYSSGHSCLILNNVRLL